MDKCVRDALNIVLSYLDLRGLEHGKDFSEELRLYPYGYTRERGLFRYCPEEIVEGYLSEIQNNMNSKQDGSASVILKSTPASQTINLDACSPIENLIDQIGRYKIACINEIYDESVDWGYLDGKNKERFVNQLRAMNSLDTEQYERTILFVWDRLITTYNDISAILTKLDKRESLYCSLLSAEEEVLSYIAAAYLHSTFRPVEYCYRSILNKMRKDIEGIGGLELLMRSADYCGISNELMLSYRNSQCEKCKVKGCMGRVSDKHGILELAGPGLDSLLFKDEGVKPEDEEFSLNYVSNCGEKEIDTLFHLLIEDNPTYSKDQFYSDLASFSKKCKERANKKDATKENRIWIANILNVLAESFYNFDIEDKKEYEEYARSFIITMEAEFMKSPYPICVRDLCRELDMYENILNVPDSSSDNEDSQAIRKETGLLPHTYELSGLFEHLGPMISFQERHMCGECTKNDCRYRNYFKHHLVDYYPEEESADSNPDERVSVSFADITTLPIEFQTKKAAEIFEKAYQIGVINDNFEPLGNRLEQSLFAGLLSKSLFGEISWKKMKMWYQYDHFAQKYGVINDYPLEKLSEQARKIQDLF